MRTANTSRRYGRVNLPDGPYVAWRGRGERVVSRVKTIGLGGLFIVTPDPPDPEDVIHLYFEVPGGAVRARAIVRSSTKGKGMGVEFTAMNSEARARLHHLLTRLLGDPYPKKASVVSTK